MPDATVGDGGVDFVSGSGLFGWHSESVMDFQAHQMLTEAHQPDDLQVRTANWPIGSSAGSRCAALEALELRRSTSP